MTRAFEDLLAEGQSVPVEGWDFSWFAGRATEGRPPWAYARLLAERLSSTPDVLDLQTGGGEVLAGALSSAAAAPGTVCATESWSPNATLATRRLDPWHAVVVEAPDAGPIPFDSNAFHSVVSRHPTVTIWPEIARVLAPGGTYLSQQVGNGTVRELTEAMIGPYDIGDARVPARLAAEAEAAGLDVVDLQVASMPMTFDDIAAVVVFLRKVIWIVPDFTVERYHDQLRRLHDRIVADGPFRATSERFLIECRKPA
ncbi:methyltransferase type 11 [Luteipulveratus mongoliensis]|uniref:Methyltransferase type 11 n=1 Tax=Luteipulveratus mongoliensis TaxID=571913 RepID=A0A0K1JH75_9MICO|nr:methyltransferase type 11 [Luteipulveratus mongoliensis]AKU16072.1 methyltransferase type 11 [Luteipulveratus mongoliensis]